jgi:type II restriction enzyme
MLPNNQTWSYFVDWEKVINNVKKYDAEIELLNSICNVDDVDDELNSIIDKNPGVTKIFGLLAAVRYDEQLVFDDKSISHTKYNFKTSNTDDKKGFKEFLKNIGILKLIKDKSISELKNYLIGVEVGLDSNARKNRSGSINEDIFSNIIQPISDKLDMLCIEQCNSSKAKQFNVNLPVESSNNIYDFVLATKDKKPKPVAIIETNFYSGGGSKLSAICGSYQTQQVFLNKKNIPFIWVTDGQLGWKTTLVALRKTFDHNDYILNLNMCKNGILEDILLNI